MTADQDLDDIEADVERVERTLVLMCHQFIYNAELPDECHGVFGQWGASSYLATTNFL